MLLSSALHEADAPAVGIVSQNDLIQETGPDHFLEPGEAIAAIADFDHACFNRSGAHSLGEFLDEKLGVIVDASFGKVGKNFALGPEAGASYDINFGVTREADIKLDITTYADAGHIDDGAAADGFEIEQIVIDLLEHTRRVEVLPCLRGIFPPRCGKEDMLVQAGH